LLDARLMRLLQQLAHRLQGHARGPHRGERRSRRRGTGGDFADLRPYTAGDDLRHLDWHAFARLDTLLVRLYEEPREHTLYILVDGSASMGLERGRFTLQLAAALAWLALARGDRAGLFLLGPEGLRDQVGPLRGKRAAHRAFSFLEGARFEGTTDLRRATEAFARQRRAGTAILLSDFLVPGDQGPQALAALARSGCHLAALHVLSPQERMPPLGQDQTFLDAETGQEMVVHVDERTRAAYLAALGALEQALRQSCRRYKAAFVPVDSQTPLEDLLMGPLQRHGLVGG
jgi:uncharacterized protein (DUF58 family)